MKIIEINNQEQWNNFINSKPHAQFLQSWQWGEFQKSLERKIWRFFIEEDAKTICAIQFIKYPLPMGKSYLVAPRGPIFSQEIKKSRNQKIKNIIDLIKSNVQKISKQEKSIHLLIEPTESIDYKISSTKTLQPKDTLILDLSKSEDDLLKEMHSKTRYNIRLAQKKGVIIIEEDGFENFWKLIEETSARDKIKSHPKNYYEKQLEILNEDSYPNGYFKLISAEYEGKTLASNIVSFFGDTVTYVHGASSNEHRNLMPTYLLQWHSIKKAKELGFKYYNFYGIAPEGAPTDHKWVGITRFKRGFGGNEINYPGTFVIPLKKFWYFLYKTAKNLRKK